METLKISLLSESYTAKFYDVYSIYMSVYSSLLLETLILCLKAFLGEE